MFGAWVNSAPAKDFDTLEELGFDKTFEATFAILGEVCSFFAINIWAIIWYHKPKLLKEQVKFTKYVSMWKNTAIY